MFNSLAGSDKRFALVWEIIHFNKLISNQATITINVIKINVYKNIYDLFSVNDVKSPLSVSSCNKYLSHAFLSLLYIIYTSKTPYYISYFIITSIIYRCNSNTGKYPKISYYPKSRFVHK